MSTGAIVITTDGPPMNELVGDDRGILVPYSGIGSLRLSTTYQVDSSALAKSIEALLASDMPAKIALSEAARRWYEKNDRLFRDRLTQSVAQLVDYD
jgi:glycosyltransferase involved in cell wall biosynthesis